MAERKKIGKIGSSSGARFSKSVYGNVSITNQHNAFEPPTNFKDDKVDMYSSSYTPAIGIDPVWFEKWAGFSMPDPSVLYFPKLY